MAIRIGISGWRYGPCSRMQGRTALPAQPNRRLRHALEVRHDSFDDPAFVRLLRRHRVALVVADSAGRYPCPADVTADFLYLRLHGDEQLYTSGYGDAALDLWATRIAPWADGGEPGGMLRFLDAPAPRRRRRDVYCYFDNDAKVRAPFDALSLYERLRRLRAGQAAAGGQTPM